jgi:hypothetical protein
MLCHNVMKEPVLKSLPFPYDDTSAPVMTHPSPRDDSPVGPDLDITRQPDAQSIPVCGADGCLTQ